MQLTVLRPQQELAADSEARLVALARLGGENAVRSLIRRNNQALFRVARAVLRDDAEAEDVVQETYVRAFTRLDSFRGESRFSTWLVRIALNEALERKRRRRPVADLADLDLAAFGAGRSAPVSPLSLLPLPADNEVMRVEMRETIERVLDDLPEAFRIVFVLRDVEGMSVEETSATLGIRQETVKTRLHRARRMMRKAIEDRLSATFADLFPFDGLRCVQMADRVIAELKQRSGMASGPA